MLILSAEQIRELDRFTIENEPITSIDLMERAACSCVDYLLKNEKLIAGKTIKVFAGQGNNGGDGLVIARHLAEKGYEVSVYCVQTANKPTDDFLQNRKRLQNQGKVSITNIADSGSFPNIYENDAVIDTLFGSGLTRKVEGVMAELIAFINKQSGMTIVIDIPSGMFCDKTSEENENAIIKAHFTLSFLPVKRAFLFQENKSFYGEVVYLDIGLLVDDYLKQRSTIAADTQSKISMNLKMSIVDYIVIEKYETKYPNPITLAIGEKVIIGEEHEATENENWENWVYCTKTDNSNSGWVPKQIISYENGLILQDYSAKELTVEKGMIVEGIEKLNGWLLSKNKLTGETGWIPMENIKPLD